MLLLWICGQFSLFFMSVHIQLSFRISTIHIFKLCFCFKMKLNCFSLWKLLCSIVYCYTYICIYMYLPHKYQYRIFAFSDPAAAGSLNIIISIFTWFSTSHSEWLLTYAQRPVVWASISIKLADICPHFAQQKNWHCIPWVVRMGQADTLLWECERGRYSEIVR